MTGSHDIRTPDPGTHETYSHDTVTPDTVTHDTVTHDAQDTVTTPFHDAVTLI